MPTIFALTGPHARTGTGEILFALIAPTRAVPLHIGRTGSLSKGERAKIDLDRLRHAHPASSLKDHYDLAEDEEVSRGVNCSIVTRESEWCLTAFASLNGVWLLEKTTSTHRPPRRDSMVDPVLPIEIPEEVYPGETVPLKDEQLFRVGSTDLMFCLNEMTREQIRDRHRVIIGIRNVQTVLPKMPWTGPTKKGYKEE